jgi:hypothetical protein
LAFLIFRHVIFSLFCNLLPKSIIFLYIQFIYFISMKNLSLKLEDELFKETENLLGRLKVSRNKYINQALIYFNNVQNRKLLHNQLVKESEMVNTTSMDVLNDFEKFEDEDQAI